MGSEIGKGLACTGAKIVVVGRSARKRDAVLNEIKELGGDAIGILCDVLDKEALLKARKKIIDYYGTVDVLINGAGGNSPSATTGPDLSLFELPENELNWVLNLNLMGTLLPIQVFGELFAEKKAGVILNISSMASLQPLTNVIGYSAAKAAVNNLTQWLAVHFNQNYSPNIRVNAIAPGFFLTEQNRFLLTDEATGKLTKRGQTILAHTPMARFGEPSDLVGTVIWLISEGSKFVTGIVVPVDGGFSAFSGV